MPHAYPSRIEANSGGWFTDQEAVLLATRSRQPFDLWLTITAKVSIPFVNIAVRLN